MDEHEFPPQHLECSCQLASAEAMPSRSSAVTGDERASRKMRVDEQRRRRGFRPLAHRTASFVILGAIVLTLIGMLEVALHFLPQVSFSASDIVEQVQAQVSALETPTGALVTGNERRGAASSTTDQSAQSTGIMGVGHFEDDSKPLFPPLGKIGVVGDHLFGTRRKSSSRISSAVHMDSMSADGPAALASSTKDSKDTDKPPSPGGPVLGIGLKSDTSQLSPRNYYGRHFHYVHFLKRGQLDGTVLDEIRKHGDEGSQPSYSYHGGYVKKVYAAKRGPTPSDASEEQRPTENDDGEQRRNLDYKGPTLDGNREGKKHKSFGAYHGNFVIPAPAVKRVLVAEETSTLLQRADSAATTIGTYPTTASADSSFPTTDLGLGKPDIIESSTPLRWIAEPHNYFLGVYLPILLAVALRLLMDYLYRYTELVSPFYMLASTNGVPLGDLFSAKHLGSDSIFAPLHAIQRKDWMLILAYSVYAAAQFIVLFASEMISVRVGEGISHIEMSSDVIQAYALCINPPIVRIIQALLLFIFIQLIHIWYLSWKSRDTLPESPASISILASLFANAETESDILQASWCKDTKAITSMFSDQRYHLQSYTDAMGNPCYGVVRVGSLSEKRIHDGPGPLINTLSRSKKLFVGRRKDSINLALITATSLTLFGIILTYAIDQDPTPFEGFMDSQMFGPRFILSGLGVIVQWPLLSFTSRTIAEIPFARLMSRPRSGRRDLVDPMPLTPLGSIWYAYQRCEWFAGSASFAAGILIELLLILLPGIPYQSDQYYEAAQFSWYASLGCLGLILLIAIIGWIRLFIKPRAAAWPRLPTTVGAVASYVACTDMSADCAVQIMPTASDKTFSFGKINGRWRVDYTDSNI